MKMKNEKNDGINITRRRSASSFAVDLQNNIISRLNCCYFTICALILSLTTTQFFFSIIALAQIHCRRYFSHKSLFEQCQTERVDLDRARRALLLTVEV